MRLAQTASRACGAAMNAGGERAARKRRYPGNVTQLSWRLVYQTQRWLSANLSNPAAGWPRKRIA